MMKTALLLSMVAGAAAIGPYLEISHVSCDFDNSDDHQNGRTQDSMSTGQGFSIQVHVAGARPGMKVGLTGDEDSSALSFLHAGEATCAEWDNRMSVYPWAVGAGDVDDDFWFKNADEDGLVSFRVPIANCEEVEYLLAVQSDSAGYCDSSSIVHFGHLMGVYVAIELTEYPAGYTWTDKNTDSMAQYFSRILASEAERNTPWKNDVLADVILDSVTFSRGGINFPSPIEYVTSSYAPEERIIPTSGFVSAVIPCETYDHCHRLKRQVRQSFVGDVSNDRLADFLGGDKFKRAFLLQNELYREHGDVPP